MMEEQQPKKEMPEFFDGNKIQANREYYINSNEYNGKTFYKIIFYQKGYDGQPQKFFKPAKFKGDPVIPNGTKIPQLVIIPCISSLIAAFTKVLIVLIMVS